MSTISLDFAKLKAKRKPTHGCRRFSLRGCAKRLLMVVLLFSVPPYLSVVFCRTLITTEEQRYREKFNNIERKGGFFTYDPQIEHALYLENDFGASLGWCVRVSRQVAERFPVQQKSVYGSSRS